MHTLLSTNLFELAQHGYNHLNNSQRYGVLVPSEFRGMPYSEQFTRIEEGHSLMYSAFESAPVTFIPPYDTGDVNTLKPFPSSVSLFIAFTQVSLAQKTVTILN